MKNFIFAIMLLAVVSTLALAGPAKLANCCGANKCCIQQDTACCVK